MSDVWCDCGEKCHESNLRASAQLATLAAEHAELVEALRAEAERRHPLASTCALLSRIDSRTPGGG